MRHWLIWMLGIVLPGWGSAQVFSLSPPQVTIDSVFFCRKAELQLAMDYPGVTIRYTLHQEEVTPSSLVFEGPMDLKKSVTLKARCFHPDFDPSPEVAIQVYKLDPGGTISTLRMNSQPNQAYPGNGAKGLTDQQKGSLAFRSSPDQWCGWELDSVQMEIVLDTPSEGGTLRWSALEDPGAWILGPAKVVLYQNGHEVGVWERMQAPDMASSRFVFPEISLPAGLTNDPISVILYATELLANHPGAGRPAWIFLDEVFLTTH